MIAVTFDRIAIAYAAEPVFTELSWEVHDDRIVGLVGPNGCGKSTMLKAIAGEVEASRGTIARRSDLTVGYLAQSVSFNDEITVFEAVRSGAEQLIEIEHALTTIEARLANSEVYEDAGVLERVLHEQEGLLEAYDRCGGPGLEARIREILHALGFGDTDLAHPVGVLSGGQKKLVGLAAQAVNRPKLLLLDEPDNHLDLDGKAYLERFLRGYGGGIVLVSHDRYLLDLVVDEINELEGGVLRRFPGNYSEYAVEKEHQRALHEHHYADQQKEIARLEQSAKRLMTWGAVYDNEKFIKRGQAILKRIERMERIDRPHIERRMHLNLNGWRGSSKVLEINSLGKSFPTNAGGDHVVLRDLDLMVRHGERVGLVGANGTGKSVLFRLILGEDAPNAGDLVLGPSVETGYYAQEHETLELERSLIDVLRHGAGISETRAVLTLQRFAFSYEQSRRPAKDLSGGERSRLQLALIMLAGANFLLLDEPTNNLDIASAEILEDALEEFDGSVLVISHDRYFLDRVVDRIVELEDGKLTSYACSYSEYTRRTGRESDRNGEPA
ncbi:ATP-binding cassette domain-containing protein [Candidatus Bipolaricaulota bacterium]|nr:ATP-binding cassette domain-containing protein [Candidatus Bipolaricaulota bacterium]